MARCLSLGNYLIPKISVVGINCPQHKQNLCVSLWTLYLSNLRLSFHLMTSHCDRLGFSIYPDLPITPESYIFGYDIIHNSSINSTSHFLSVSCTFLTLPVYISCFFSWNRSSFTSPVSAMSSLLHLSPCIVCSSPASTDRRFRSGVIYRVMQGDAYSTDHLSDEGDFSGVGMRWFSAFDFWSVPGTGHKDIIY